MTEQDVAIEAARAAGVVIASASSVQVDLKGEVDLVTQVDVAAEAALRDVLGRHTPDVPVLGEEGGGAVGASTRWIVDPLDGTTNFVHGFPFYCVSVGLQVDGELTVGVVLDVPRQRVYAATRGRGAWCGDQRLAVSAVRRLDEALVGTGFPYDRRQRSAYYLARVDAFLQRTQGLRRAGAAALDLALVAAGALDGFWEFGLKPWDIAAGIVLIEEAGGRVSAHDGGPLDLMAPKLLASNGEVHQAMVAVLEGS